MAAEVAADKILLTVVVVVLMVVGRVVLVVMAQWRIGGRSRNSAGGIVVAVLAEALEPRFNRRNARLRA